MKWPSIIITITAISTLCNAYTTGLSIVDTQSPYPSLQSRNFFDFDGELVAKAVGTWVPLNSLLCTNPVLLSMGIIPCVGATAVSAFGGLALTFKALWRSGRKDNHTLQGRSVLLKRDEVVISSCLSEIVVQDEETFSVYCDRLTAKSTNPFQPVFSSTHSLCNGNSSRQVPYLAMQERRTFLHRRVWKTVAPALSNYVLETGSDRTILDAAFSYNIKEETGEFRIKTADYKLEGSETIKKTSWVAVTASASLPMINLGNDITCKTMNERFWELAFVIGSQAFEHKANKVKLSSMANMTSDPLSLLSALIVLDAK